MKKGGHPMKFVWIRYFRLANLLGLCLIAAMTSGVYADSGNAQQATDIAAQAQMRINDAIPVVGKMKEDPQVNDLLQKSKGVVIVPHYIQAALVFGGRGGAGVLLVHHDAHWSNPAFYKLSGGSFGAQIGGTKGALVLMLMSDRAVDAFENKDSTWSMNAGAGLTAVNYSKQTPESQTLSDVVVWSDTKGLFGGAAVGASKISRDTAANQAYYNSHDLTVQQILSSAVTNPNAKLLIDVMPVQQAAKK
jgi:lipid-binding SYLF domain-containing protein